MTARQRSRVLPLWPADDAPEPHWTELALCAQTDPEIFFPEKGGSTRQAKAVCRRCDVRAECLEQALANDERFGIFGGLSERERRRLSRRNQVQVPVDHQRCAKCEEIKPLTAFHRNSETKTGRTGKCASCRNGEDSRRVRDRTRVAA